ncbi:MAG: SusD/RagB family nutrient-binding outer membrane lipoprotein [Prevotellaceae bacterium]|nr:SusD/RagB family nutrient-binding outer membrane lipoprotein [Prevotellaceae bacterium]
MKNIATSLLALLFALSFVGCTKDFLDVNKDPNRPETADLSHLLSGGEYTMVQAFSQGNFIGNNLSSYVHQLVSREVQNYGMNPQANNPLNTWNYAYTHALSEFDAIIKVATPDGNLIYAGIAKTLKAYAFSVMVDLWGDIPYSKFNVSGVTAPHPDHSAVIYNSLIALLEDARADLSDTTAANPLKPAGDDLLYAGNAAKWLRLCNTLKLKLLLQSRKAKSDVTEWQTKLSDLVGEGSFIASGEDFQFWFNEKTNPADQRHPAYLAEYGGMQTTYYVSPFFYEIMKGQTHNCTANPFAGVEDPRVPYYFYNQLKKEEKDMGSKLYEYRNGEFVSIFFATLGSNSSVANDNLLTKVGLYLCGGKYDDGAGGRVTQYNAGNGYAPHKMLTFAALKFMLAELVLAGETSGDARALLKEAMEAAVDHVNSVASKQKNVPAITNAARDSFTGDILAKYDAAPDNSGRMEIVMTQKWIANVFNPVDAYTDYRRTGYPTLFAPERTSNPGYGVNLTPNNYSPAQVPIRSIAQFPRSLYYPVTSETDLNPNLKQKIDLSAKLLFWDK